MDLTRNVRSMDWSPVVTDQAIMRIAKVEPVINNPATAQTPSTTRLIKGIPRKH